MSKFNNTPLAPNGQPSQETNNQIHSKVCLCADCLFLPRVKDAESYVHWVENRLAKTTPRWQEHWQQQLAYAWQSFNYWKRQYQADKATTEVMR